MGIDAIAQALRGVGASVQSLGVVGNGCPSLLVSHRNVNYLIEVKRATQLLTQAQIQWRDDWRAPVHVVLTIAEALAVIGMGHHT